jgi:hypothetical protein
MTTIAEIKAAIEALSPQEYCELMALLNPREDDDWDLQMQSDAESGRLDALREQARADLMEGRCIPLVSVNECAL